MKSLSGGRGGRAMRIGLKVGQAVINDTKAEYEIDGGYSTVANGYADRIAIAPGEVALLNSGGGPRDFASWSIGQRSEFKGVKIVPLTDCLRYA